MGCHHHGPFSTEKKTTVRKQNVERKYIIFLEKNHTKHYTKIIQILLENQNIAPCWSCLCFPVLLQVLSACCSANCAKCDVVPASVVKNNRM